MFVLIPARGGSKGVPRKNIKKLNGKPLIHYAIESARKLFPDEKILVSTDDEEIKEVVEQTGLNVPFLRPKELASDSASTRDVILHSIEYMEGKGEILSPIILLQPTSPFRTFQHIKEALNLYSEELDMVVSVNESRSNPYYSLFEENTQGFLVKSKSGDFTRRQDVPKVYEYNGAIYIINVKSFKERKDLTFKKVVKYVMDEQSSLDIDNQIDWMLAELFLKNEKKT